MYMAVQARPRAYLQVVRRCKHGGLNFERAKNGFGIMDSVEFVDATHAALRFDAARCHSRHGAPPPFQIKFQRNTRTQSICRKH